MEIKRLGTTKLTVKFNTKHTNWDDTQTDFIGIEGEARSRCYSFKIQDAEGINFISENVKMLFKERGSSKVYFSKAVWSQEEEVYYCDIPGNILQKTQIIDIQVCIEDGTTRILTPVITKQVLSSLMSGASASSGNDIYIDFENLNDIQKIIDSEEERKKNELERIEENKRVKAMLDTNLDSELNKYVQKEELAEKYVGENLIENSDHEWTVAKIDRNSQNVLIGASTNKFYLEGLKAGDILSYSCRIRITGIEELPTVFSVGFSSEGNVNKWRTSVSSETISFKKEDYEVGQIINVHCQATLKDRHFKEDDYQSLVVLRVYNLNGATISIRGLKIEKGNIATIWTPNRMDVINEVKKKEEFITKTEIVSQINLLNAKIDATKKKFVTKNQFLKRENQLEEVDSREKKVEVLVGMILEELRKQNPNLNPINVHKVFTKYHEEK